MEILARAVLLFGVGVFGAGDPLPPAAPERPLRVADVGPPPSGRPRRRLPPRLPAKRHKAIRLKWKTKVGLTHFRHTIVAVGTKVLVGSNGSTFNHLGEADDAMYVIDGRTGRRVRKINHPAKGDRDVNGVATDGTYAYFGSDTDVLYKYRLRDGRMIWKRKLDGDIEGTPALARLNRGAVLDVVVGTEAGSVYAVDGRRGRVLWRRRTGAQSMYGSRGILASPAVGDLDGDRVADVVVGARDGFLRAFRGRRGRPLWKYRTGSGIHASVTLRDLDRDGKLDVLGATAYSELFAIKGRTGRVLWRKRLSSPTGGIEGLFSSPVVLPLGRRSWCALIGTAWWGRKEGLYCVSRRRVHWRFKIPRGKISSSAVVADLLPARGFEVAFGGEDGNLYLLSSAGALLMRWPTRGAIECTPTVADIDGDGKLELLVASQDGKLYAFDTPGRGPVARGSFRGDAAGTGRQPPRAGVAYWLRQRGRPLRRPRRLGTGLPAPP